MEDAGRWALTRRGKSGQLAGPDAVEHVARSLLRRYGVVFWRSLEREADWLPPWRELLRVFHRLEARGEIRGGRFVAGFSGEQFALPEAIGLLRETRRRNEPDGWVLGVRRRPAESRGHSDARPKLAALAGNRLLYRDGLPVAALAGGEARFYQALDPGAEWQVRKALLLGATPPATTALSLNLDPAGQDAASS